MLEPPFGDRDNAWKSFGDWEGCQEALFSVRNLTNLGNTDSSSDHTQGRHVKLKGSHLGILEGFVLSRERGFDRLGRCLDLARPLSLAQPGAGMFQPAIIVRNERHASDMPLTRRGEVHLP